MSVQFAILPILLLLALLLGGLVLLVVLVANQSTRKLGLVLMAVAVLGIPVLMVGGALLSYQRVQRIEEVEEVRVHDQVARLQAQARQAQAGTLDQVSAPLPPGYPSLDLMVEGRDFPMRAPGAMFQTSMRSWAVIALILVGIGGVYVLLKLLNSPSSSGVVAVLALTGLGLLSAIFWMRASVQRPMMATQAREQAARTADQDWETLTRPRIDLSERPKEVGKRVDAEGLVKYKVVANGRELIFNEDTPMDDAIAQIKKIWLADGKKLKLKTNGYSAEFSGGFGADFLGNLLHKSLALARLRAAKEEIAEADKQKDPAPPAEKVVEVDAAEERPTWIDQPPKRIGKIYRQVIATGPYATADECYGALSRQLLDAAADYLRRQRSGAGQYADQLPSLGITPAMLLQEVCVEEYLETFESKSLGKDMKRLYVQVEFDEAFRQRLDRAYLALERRGAVEGVTLAGVLGLLLVGGSLRAPKNR